MEKEDPIVATGVDEQIQIAQPQRPVFSNDSEAVPQETVQRELNKTMEPELRRSSRINGSITLAVVSNLGRA